MYMPKLTLAAFTACTVQSSFAQDAPPATNSTSGNVSASILLSSYPWAAAVAGIEIPDTINGIVPEGTPVSVISSRMIAASSNSDGALTIVYRDIRTPGTRVPIHIHRYAGTTCVQQGAMQVHVDGQEEFVAEAGACFVMPSMTKISAMAIGEVDVIMHDVFRVPCGEPTITFIESCCLDLNVVDSYAMYSTFAGSQAKLECGDTFYFDPHVEEFSAYKQNVTCDRQQDNLFSSSEGGGSGSANKTSSSEGDTHDDGHISKDGHISEDGDRDNSTDIVKDSTDPSRAAMYGTAVATSAVSAVFAMLI